MHEINVLGGKTYSNCFFSSGKNRQGQTNLHLSNRNTCADGKLWVLSTVTSIYAAILINPTTGLTGCSDYRRPDYETILNH